MARNSNIQYHLQELEIAQDPTSAQCILPLFLQSEQVILDVGCGIGQTFVASNLKGRNLLVGLDVDFESLAYGQRSYNYIRFVNAVAEFLPFQDACFDIVISRVSLPYTNIPKSLREISRVLKKGGRVWLTLHSFSGTISKLVTAFVEFNFKGVIHYIYVIMNGVALHLLGKQFVLPGIKKYDSCQSQRGIKKALEHAGFKNIVINTKKHFIISAQKL